MLDKYTPLVKICDYIINDIDEPKIHGITKNEKGGRSFLWSKSCKEDKVHTSRCLYCEYGDRFAGLKSIEEYYFQKTEAQELFNLIKKPHKDNFPINITLCIFQNYNNCIIERAKLKITGDLSKENKINKAMGTFEIVMINDEATVIETMMHKYIHDIKNQMMLMISISNNIQSATDDITLKKYAHTIKDTVYSCNYMLGMMDMQKQNKDNNKLFNMHLVINSLLDTMNSESDIALSCDLKAENPRIYGDKVLLTNVVYNVIVNAIQELEHNGNITIRSYNKRKNPNTEYKWSKWLYIEIEDDGGGIDDEIIDMIFKTSFTTKINGSGLGLYSCRETINKHNGTISVTSKKGHGATFIICLPSHIE